MEEADTVDVVPREEWKARPARGLMLDLKLPVELIMARWTDSDPCHDKKSCLEAVERLQHKHMGPMDLEDIGYNFLIGGDNQVYEGRGWKIFPMITEGYEDLQLKSILVGYIGNEGTVPHRDRLMICENLIALGKKLGYLSRYTSFIPIFDIYLSAN